jgi:hypothetical protein
MLLGGTGRRHWLMHSALVVYTLSFVLPSVKIDLFGNRSFEPGYWCALCAELTVWDFNTELAAFALQSGPPPARDKVLGWFSMIGGATANHFFLLAYALAMFRRPRIAALCAVLSAACALGCLLPAQILALDGGWGLGPGYFVWCAAPVILAVGGVAGRVCVSKQAERLHHNV